MDAYAEHAEGTAVSYTCTAEVFTPPGGPTEAHPVRVLKVCPEMFGRLANATQVA